MNVKTLQTYNIGIYKPYLAIISFIIRQFSEIAHILCQIRCFIC